MDWPIRYAGDAETLRTRLNNLQAAGKIVAADQLFSGSYNDLTDVPSSFTPAAHSHVAADVTDISDYLKRSGGVMTGNINMGDQEIAFGSNQIVGAPLSLFGSFSGSPSSDPIDCTYGDFLIAKVRSTAAAAGAGSALVQIGDGTMTILASANMTNTSTPAAGAFGITFSAGDVTLHASGTSFLYIGTVLKIL